MNWLRRDGLRLCVWGLLLALTAPRLQAAETSAPSTQEAGPEERRFRRRGPPEPPERRPPQIEDRLGLPDLPEAPAGPPFTVRTIRVQPDEAIPADVRQRVVGPYEGRTVTLADLQRLAAELTRWLRGQGKVTSRAYIPPQEVVDGVVTIQILEGRIGEIRVEGTTYSRPSTLTRRMQTKPGTLLDYRRLQQDLGRLNAGPDRRVTAVLLPGRTTGTTDILLRVQETSPWHAGLLANNTGTKFTGRHRQGVTLGHQNVTGHDDQLVLRAEVAGERTGFIGGTAGYLLPLGASGRTLSVDLSHAQVTLGRQFRPRDLEGTATVLGVTWAEPWFQTAHWEAEWAVGFDAKRIRSRENGSDQGKDELRILRVGPNVLEQDASGRSIVATEVGIGFSGILGASGRVDPSASRPETGGQFVRLTIAGGRLQRLFDRLQLLLRGAWQWTNDRLPPAEAMRLGGAETVRGYPEGEFLGDYGYSGTAELRVPLPFFRRGERRPLTLVAFVDGGAGFLRHPLQAEEEKRRLIGVGFGLRWVLTPYTQASVDLGFPVGDTSIEKDTPRLSYGVAVGF